MPNRFRRSLRRGFTLIEMVLVLIILATIAGLVISQISMLGRTADMAATAKTQQDIANQLGLYFALQKRMPQRMDSLLVPNGTSFDVLIATDGAGNPVTNANLQRWGLPYAGANGTRLQDNLTPRDLADSTAFPVGQPVRSFTRLGFDVVMDHAPAGGTITNCNESGTIHRPLSNSSCWVATVNEGGPLAAQIYPSPDGVLPAGTFPDGVAALVALGVGPRSSLIPDTMLNAPIYPGCDGSYYGHYVAIFACFVSGERAQLVAVCDSYGRLPNYSIQQFNESLPNNGRQG